MLPIAIANSYNPVQASLVNTTLPGSVVTHVPYDNVAPSISSAQVNNNASPNSDAAQAAEQAVATTEPQNDTQASIAVTNIAQSQIANTQATFLAQLMSQDGSPTTQVILVQYEKLIALGNVKYKPSNALKPPAAPSSVFGQLLQQSKPVAPVQPVQPQPPPAPPAATPATAAEEAVAANPVPVVVVPPRQPALPRNTNSTAGNNTITVNQAAANPTRQIISAYTATASRVTSQQLETTTELA